MITRETLESGLIRTYSDSFKIRKVGTDEIYSEAVDVPTSDFKYEETDEPLDPSVPEPTNEPLPLM